MKIIRQQTLAKLLVGFLGIVLIGCLLYQDATIRTAVVGVAGKLGKPAVPFLRNALHDESSQVRGKADHALRELGEGAVPSLADSLADPDPQIREEAARALLIVGKKAKLALPVLLLAFKSETNGKTRALVAMVLGQLGNSAADAVPHLLPALKDADATVRASSAEALSMIAPADEIPTIVAALSAALQDDVANVRLEAAEGLGRIGPRAAAGVKALTKALQDPNKGVKREAAEALERVRGKDKDPVSRDP
jgi:HEAT repeat protein